MEHYEIFKLLNDLTVSKFATEKWNKKWITFDTMSTKI